MEKNQVYVASINTLTGWGEIHSAMWENRGIYFIHFPHWIFARFLMYQPGGLLQTKRFLLKHHSI